MPVPKIRGGRIEDSGGLEWVADSMGCAIATSEKILWVGESLGR